MLVTLSGMVMDVKPVQPEKELSSMLVTLSGMTRSVTNTPFRYRLCA